MRKRYKNIMIRESFPEYLNLLHRQAVARAERFTKQQFRLDIKFAWRIELRRKSVVLAIMILGSAPLWIAVLRWLKG